MFSQFMQSMGDKHRDTVDDSWALLYVRANTDTHTHTYWKHAQTIENTKHPTVNVGFCDKL